MSRSAAAPAKPSWEVVGDTPLSDAAIAALARLLLDAVEKEEHERAQPTTDSKF